MDSNMPRHPADSTNDPVADQFDGESSLEKARMRMSYLMRYINALLETPWYRPLRRRQYLKCIQNSILYGGMPNSIYEELAKVPDVGGAKKVLTDCIDGFMLGTSSEVRAQMLLIRLHEAGYFLIHKEHLR